MKQLIYNLYLLYTNNEDIGFGIIKFQTNDILIIGNKKFVQAKEKEFKNTYFIVKDCKELIYDYLLKFNNITFAFQKDDIYFNQKKQYINLQLVFTAFVNIHGTHGKVRKNVSIYNQYIA